MLFALLCFANVATGVHFDSAVVAAGGLDQGAVYLSDHTSRQDSTHLDPIAGVRARHCPGCLLRVREGGTSAPTPQVAAEVLESRLAPLPPTITFSRNVPLGSVPRGPPLG